MTTAKPRPRGLDRFVLGTGWDTALIIVAGDGAAVLATVERVMRARMESHRAAMMSTEPSAAREAQSERMRAYLFADGIEAATAMRGEAIMRAVEPYCTAFPATLFDGAPAWRADTVNLLIVAGVGRSEVDRDVAVWIGHLAPRAMVYVTHPVEEADTENAAAAVRALAGSKSAGLRFVEEDATGWLLGRRVSRVVTAERSREGI